MRRRTRLALLGLCAALRVVSLIRPCLSDDEAIYAVVAREMLAGHALYDGIVDHKPPAIYVVYAATQALGGPVGGMLLLHLLLIGVVYATAMVLAGIVRRCGPGLDPRAPAAAALLWIVYTTTLVDVDALAANCELFMMLPLVASVAVFVGGGGRVGRTALAGVLVGVATLFKYQGGVMLPVFGLAALLGWPAARGAGGARGSAGAGGAGDARGSGGAGVGSGDREPGEARGARGAERGHVGGGEPPGFGERIAAIGALAAGFAVPIAVAIGVLAWAGALAAAEFWWRFNFAYIEDGTSLRELVVRLGMRGGLVVGSAALLYALGVAALAGARREPAVRFFAGWLVASGLAVFVGGRFFGHYFHQLTAPLAVLAAPGLVRLWDARRALVIAAIAVPALVWLALGALHDRVMAWYGEPDPDYASVVRWLDARGPGGLCVWGNSPVLYFAAERPLGCRFAFANYLTGASPATASQTDAAVDSSRQIVPAAWDMLERDLGERQPRFIVDGSPGNVAFYGKYPPARFPRLQRILDCAYEAQAVVAGMRIYERRAAPRCTLQ